MSSGGSVVDKVQSWLREEGIQFNKLEETNRYVLSFWPSPGLKLNVEIIIDKVIIGAIMLFAETTKHAFSSNQQYFHDLDLTLHQQTPNFRFVYEDHALLGVTIFKRIWSESLTKTSFFDSISAVEHSAYTVEIKQRQLSIMKT
jgi:hypothetical protein